MLLLLLFSFLILKSQNEILSLIRYNEIYISGFKWNQGKRDSLIKKFILRVALGAENQEPPKYLPSWWQAKGIISICEMQLYQFEHFYLQKQRSQLKWNTTQCFTRLLELSSYCSFYLMRKKIYCFEIHCYRIHYGTINLI